jgi:coenzyme Q-binding protein COQ10
MILPACAPRAKPSWPGNASERLVVVTVFHTTRRIAFAPEYLLAIVADVASYPEFLPLCTGARVWDAKGLGDGRRSFRASLDIEYPKLRLKETFVSDVLVDTRRGTIRATSCEGPVKHIDNRWLFTAARGGCDIDFHLDYQMSSRLLHLAMGSVFEFAVRKVMTAFEERAHVLQQNDS